MRILGIDPGTAITGWGIVDGDNPKPTAIDYGHIATKAGLDLAKRLHIIHDELRELIIKYKPDVASVEQLFFAKNAKTAIAVGHARGVILLTAQQLGLEIFEYTPMQIKQAVTGYGAADKRQMQLMIKQVFGLKEIPTPDDVADALAIALCHNNTYKWKSKIANSIK